MPDSILVVEDDEEFADLLGLLLTKKGYEVKVAYSGLGAIEAASTFIPDVILQDYMLPDIHGVDLLTRLKKTCPETNLIVMTAKGSEGVAVDVMKAGAADYLSKPFETEKLLITIENTLKLRSSQAAFRKVRQELRSANNELTALNAISGTLVSTMPPAEKYSTAAGILLKNMKADVANIFVSSEPGGNLALAASKGFDDDAFTECDLSRGKGLVSYVAETKEPSFVPVFKSEERFIVPVEIHERGLVSGLAAPMLVEDTVIGVVALYFKYERTVNPVDMKLISNFANLIALSPAFRLS